MHPQILQRLYRLWNAGEDRHADMFDEHLLRRRRAALHAVHHHDIRAGLHRQRRVVIGPRPADLHIDRLLPVGDLAQLEDLDLEVVGARPVRVAAGRALVDALGKVAHLRHAIRDLLAQQHSPAARLCPLPDNDLDRIRPAQVIGIHAIAAGKNLVDQRPGVASLLLGHAAIARGGRCARRCRPAAQRLLGRAGESPEAHARNGDRDLQMNRLLRMAGAEPDIGGAFLAVAFQRIAADRGTEKQQVVEMRQVPLGAAAADVIDAGGGRPADFRIHRRRERGREAGRRSGEFGHVRASVGRRIVDVEVVEPAGRAVAPELLGPGLVLRLSPAEQIFEKGVMLIPHLLLDAVGAQ
ncbi:hypothetical protein ruthe_02567 [Rubellimicrobium thermophilum DSM 16684]|uniref:Uncharacterized protein n=1 Tax=Rubellimicrobium thermophilum DSM 16684 TaxID=1123069 RepID=S9QQU4_9RHOB|nr:hypothetical protein ruthe_02567 [Rubellimicrobium thermophilum DSM 16684]